MLNKPFFYEQIRTNLFLGKISAKQFSGLEAILTEWEAHHAADDDRWLAYMLATTHHETDKTMQPIEEYGKGKGRQYGLPDSITKKVYYGRGFVQLTWKTNYEKMCTICDSDLVNKPELALDLKVATKVMFYGMMNGSFTGKKLGDYFNHSKEDWINARRIINGIDKANLIAGYARQYYAAISHTV